MNTGGDESGLLTTLGEGLIYLIPALGLPHLEDFPELPLAGPCSRVCPG